MTPETFSTQPLRPRDQLEAWREWYSSVFEVIPDDPLGDGFPGETGLWKLDGLVMSRTTALPGRVIRTKHHLRHDPADHWVISYCVRGGFFAKVADTEVEGPARVPFLWSLRQELSYERTHVDWVQFFLARDEFREIAPLLDAALGSILDTPLGRLLGDYMIALERRLPDVTQTDFSRITTALSAMVAAAVAPSAERSSVAKSQIDLGRKERVRQAVRRHLRTPTLEPKTLSRLVGMSRFNIYRLFEDAGGVARYIQRERLLEARAVLSDPATTRSISAIAEDLCFAAASSFSRTFKREFGHSPSEARSAALSGLKLGVTQRTRVPSAGTHFGDLLRGFQHREVGSRAAGGRRLRLGCSVSSRDSWPMSGAADTGTLGLHMSSNRVRGRYDYQQCDGFSNGGRLPSGGRDHPSSSSTGAAAHGYREACPDNESWRRLRLRVCAAERGRKRSIRAAAAEKSRFSAGADAERVWRDR